MNNRCFSLLEWGAALFITQQGRPMKKRIRYLVSNSCSKAEDALHIGACQILCRVVGVWAGAGKPNANGFHAGALRGFNARKRVLHHHTIFRDSPSFLAATKNTSGSGLLFLMSFPSATASNASFMPIFSNIMGVLRLEEPIAVRTPFCLSESSRPVTPGRDIAGGKAV